MGPWDAHKLACRPKTRSHWPRTDPWDGLYTYTFYIPWMILLIIFNGKWVCKFTHPICIYIYPSWVMIYYHISPVTCPLLDLLRHEMCSIVVGRFGIGQFFLISGPYRWGFKFTETHWGQNLTKSLILLENNPFVGNQVLASRWPFWNPQTLLGWVT